MADYYLLVRRGDGGANTGDDSINEMRISEGQVITYKSREYLLSMGMDPAEPFPMRGEGDATLKCIVIDIQTRDKIPLLDLLVASDPPEELGDPNRTEHWQKRANVFDKATFSPIMRDAIFTSDTEVVTRVAEDILNISNVSLRPKKTRVQNP
jgi:hypothetical protein